MSYHQTTAQRSTVVIVIVMYVDLVICRHDTGKDGFIDLMELKLMMEKLGAPQTHLGVKNMIKEVDEDFDGKLSFREVRHQEVVSGSCTQHRMKVKM